MVHFFPEDVSFEFAHSNSLSQWIDQTITEHKKELGDVNYIFCSDSYLHEINLQYLDHDTFTDIITFDQSENDQIEGDIFISIDRVRENARDRRISFEDELHRVMIHGILHLLGYNDKTPKEKQLMREKEDECLSLRNLNE